MLEKLRKHSTVVQNRIKEKATIKAIKKEGNSCLNHIVNAFYKAKQMAFSDEELSAIKRCEAYRKNLLADNTEIDYTIFGVENRLVSEICKSATSNPSWAKFIYALCREMETPNVLEIGTNLGVSGSFILEALKGKKVSNFTTMEGVTQLCKIASNQFKTIVKEDEFKIYEGLYDDTFPILMQSNQKDFNLLFIDGYHQKEPTLQFFEKLKMSKIQEKAIFIFDDINWSKGMQEAWELIKTNPEINYSIDFYKLGIIIIDKNSSNRSKHFNLFFDY